MKMKREFIPFSPPLIGDEEIREMVDSLKSGWITTGPKVTRFEEDVCARIGVPHAAATFSCTAALFLTLKALGIG
jgi:dTDP-4-amino-4,6-dideoxygalactose transaminase